MTLFELLNRVQYLLWRVQTRLWYALGFKRIGRKSVIMGNLTYQSPQFIEIGKGVRIGPGCRLEAYPGYAGQTSSPSLVLKDGAVLQHKVHVYCRESVEIGENSLIASGCMITDNNHGMVPGERPYVDQPLIARPTVLESNVWLGEHVCVLAGSRIGAHSIIGCNSVVSGEIPPFSIAAGCPAKVLKKYNPSSKAWERVKG
jgi:lipopolysaccharide O-acetyltransferase